MIKLSHIPSLLVGMRFAIAPLLVLDALDHKTSLWFMIGYVIAVLSDIFDGMIARRLKISTAQLRQADSWADIRRSRYPPPAIDRRARVSHSAGRGIQPCLATAA